MSLNKRLYVICLGCPKNRVDLEKALPSLKSVGVDLTADVNEADIVLVNTCAFIPEARLESENVIRSLQKWRMSSSDRRILAMGCWPLYQKEDMKYADGTVWGHKADDMLHILYRIYGLDKTFIYNNVAGRLLTTPKSYAYLSIAEGCDGNCTYCSIPSFRGPYRSVPIKMLSREARGLLKSDIREIVLVAQDVAYYGSDGGNRENITSLVKLLCQLDTRPYWVRLMYCHPAHIPDSLLDLFGETEHLLPYMDVPIQHASNSILRAMGRNIDLRRMERIFERLNKIENMTIRTTVMTGFPGETERDVEILISFLEEFGVHHVGAFEYCQEPKAPSCRMRNQLPWEVAHERAERIRGWAEKRALDRHRGRVGNYEEVLIDEEIKDGIWECRSMAEAPEVDPFILVDPGEEKILGNEFMRLRIISAEAGYLRGVPAP